MIRGLAPLLFAFLSAQLAWAGDYREGQVWNYKTRDHEAGSTFYIMKVDELETGQKVYHLKLEGLAIRSPLLEGGVQTSMPHCPVGIETLEASATELVSQQGDVEVDWGAYQYWREAYEAGEGGWFTVPLDQVVAFLESMVQPGQQER